MSYDTTGLTVILPQNLDSLEPIQIIDRAGLKAVLVERYALEKLPEDWYMGEGFYVLLSQLSEDNSFTAYVGQTDYSFRLRLHDHDDSKDFWRVAVLFKRAANDDPFTRTETRYLEGIMVDALKSSPNVKVTNIKPTGEKNMPDHNKAYMETMLLSALRVLFMRGYRNQHLGSITRKLETAQNKPTITPTPVLASTPRQTPGSADTNTALRKICQHIYSTTPESQKSYQYWSGNKLLAQIAETKPTTKEELSQIPGVRNYLLLGAAEITALFR